jgi:hypothetical protein
VETRIFRTRSHPILVSAEDIKILVQLLSKHYSDAKFCASCSDGSRLTTNDVDEILQFDNPTSRKIQKLEISFNRGGFDDSGDVELGDFGLCTTQITVRGGDDVKVSHVASEINRQLAEYKPWYWLLLKLRPSIILWVALISYLVVVNWRYVLLTGKLVDAKIGFDGFISMIYLLIPVMLVLIPAVIYLDKAWDWLFPKVWFLIGRQLREFERRASVRRFVFIAIGLSLIVGVASNFVYSFLIRR